MAKTKTTMLEGYRPVYSTEPMSVRQMLAPSYTPVPTEELVGYKEKKGIFGDVGLDGLLAKAFGGGKRPIYQTRNIMTPTENTNYTDFVDYAYRLLNPNLHNRV